MAEIKISSVKLFTFYAKLTASAAAADISVKDRNGRGRMSWQATFKEEVCGLATTSP
ncbi:hypothetical protein [Janthinobacterium aquaticum]|uniref:hypothetical protein n=1 Tax=Janthinobacterium sp. FT58W TaxID=2654254 RepID=UPI00186B1CBC|nr:hypothetical protein [Janthinobacterium sp. FT58W]